MPKAEGGIIRVFGMVQRWNTSNETHQAPAVIFVRFRCIGEGGKPCHNYQRVKRAAKLREGKKSRRRYASERHRPESVIMIGERHGPMCHANIPSFISSSIRNTVLLQ